MIILLFFIIGIVLGIISFGIPSYESAIKRRLIGGLTFTFLILGLVQFSFINEVTRYSYETDDSVRTQIIRQGQYDMIVLGKLSDETILKQQEYNENVSTLQKLENNIIVKYNGAVFEISFDRICISDTEFIVDNLSDESKENLREYILNELS